MNLVTALNNLNDYENEITAEMDKHLVKECKEMLAKGYGSGSYIHSHINPNSMVLRFPGATRGHIEFDNEMVILKIVLYPDKCFGKLGCYKPSVRYAVQKYVGSKIVIKKKEVEGK